MHATDQDDIASGLRVAEAEYRLQRAGGGDEDGKKRLDASHHFLLARDRVAEHLRATGMPLGVGLSPVERAVTECGTHFYLRCDLRAAHTPVPFPTVVTRAFWRPAFCLFVAD